MEFDETAYRSFRKDLYRLAHHRLGDHYASEDVVQESFLRLARYRPASITNMAAMLKRIANNLIIDQARLRERREEDEMNDNFDAPFDEPSHEQVLLQRERVEQVSQILDEMPPQRRKVFIMRRLHGLSAREVAETLGMSPAAVDTQVARAVLAIHKRMATFEEKVNA